MHKILVHKMHPLNNEQENQIQKANLKILLES